MSVPKEAASTKAKVTISFSAWKEACIAPATFEVPIEEVSPETEAREEREAEKRAGASRRGWEKMIASWEEQLKREKDPRIQRDLQGLIQHGKKALRDMEKP